MATAAICVAQPAAETFDEHYDKAIEYSNINLYAASLEELNSAIDIATAQGWEEKRIMAGIALAELMRKTWDYERGVEILKGLEGTERYPRLHVRKLGRLAALYHEGEHPGVSNPLDSVRFYLDEAITLAEAHGFETEEAGLKNELGYFISRNDNRSEGSRILRESAQLFLQHGDTHNYVVPMIHVLENRIQQGGDKKSIDSLALHLRETVAGKEWYATEIDLFNVIASQKASEGDSLGRLRWEMEAAKSFVKANNVIHSGQMAATRVLQETRKYQEEAERSALFAREKSEELERETARTRELVTSMSILAVLAVGVVFLLLRERKLKHKVDVANEKYHMLLVESNHRIKNNLQMIISMLEYASKDLPGSETSALKRMSAKIHTISALHKHLYLDVHNEQVDLDTYFNEIITLYRDISPETLHVEKHVERVGIKSERIIYFGLIFNEMLANTIEHHNTATKDISIRVQRDGNSFLYRYRDGSSWPGDVKQGTGSLLIRQLIQRVGGTDFSFDPTTGQYQFHFRV